MKSASLILLLVGLVGCVSTTDKEPDGPLPYLSRDMETPLLVDEGVEFGGKTLQNAKDLIQQKNDWARAALHLNVKIIDNHRTWAGPQLINAIHLYISSKPTNSIRVFDLLVGSDRPLANKLAWQVATALPSEEVGRKIDDMVSEAILKDDLGRYFAIPQFASAVGANRLRSLYPTMKIGLFDTQHPEFAKAMIRLDGARSRADLMDFLAMAPREELRQMSFSSINEITCMIALEALFRSPVSAAHPRIHHLFYYSVSRNRLMSSLANKIIDKYSISDGELMALRLSRLDAWVQIAFIESSRRNLGAVRSQFLKRLKQVASQVDVVDELRQTRL